MKHCHFITFFPQVLRWAVYAYIMLSVFALQDPMHHKESEVSSVWMTLLFNFPLTGVKMIGHHKGA